MRFLSVCSGIEAASVAWSSLGWKAVAFSEIEPFPCAVLAHHYPDTPNWGDTTKFEEWPDVPIDLLCGGTPCFPAGTVIATARGFVPIEQVRIGDMALTHAGRFRRVLRTGSKLAPTVVVRGQGHFGMVTTANHPFWSRKKTGRSTRIAGKAVRLTDISPPEWVRADMLAGRHWACVSHWPELPWDRPIAEGRELSVNLSDEALFTLAGAYLGDGWSRTSSRRGYVFLGLNEKKLAQLRPVLDGLSTYTVAPIGTSVRVQISSRPLARWLALHFGVGAAQKSVPMWALGLPRALRDALIRGYQITDGGRVSATCIRATTISRQLALTMRSLAVSTGHASSVGHSHRPAISTIEGREVQQRDTFTVSFGQSDRSSFEDDGFRWQCVRSVEPTGSIECVFDLEIEGDHSYVADGIVVHNCQSFSVAGLRKGLDDPRGNLMLTYGAIAAKYRPRWLVWENVPGVLSSNSGRDFGTFLGFLGQLGYGFAYRVLDAQHFGVPRRRRRVFVVGCRGDWRAAAAVLFERHSLQGHPAPRRKEKEDIAPSLVAGAGKRGGIQREDGDGGLIAFGGNNTAGPIDIATALNACASASGRMDFESETFIAHSLRGEGFDASEDGTGRGTPLVPVAFDTTQITSPMNHSNPQAGDPCHTLAKGMHAPAIAFQTQGESHGWMDGGTPQGSDDLPAGTVRTVWSDQSGSASQERGLARPFAGESTAPLPQLPHQSAPEGSDVHAVRQATQRLRVLRHALPEVQEVGRPDEARRPRKNDLLPAGLRQSEPQQRAMQQARPAVATRHSRTAADDQERSRSGPVAVRRLMPVECERLQGFPDNYTAVSHRGKPAADGPRYKALGNSWAVPCVRWIGERIDMVEALVQANVAEAA